MSWHERMTRGHGFMVLATAGFLLNVSSQWLPEWIAPGISWLGSGLTWTGVVIMVYALYHVLGPGVRLSTWWRMRRMGWKWKHISFASPCGKREIRRLEPGQWAAVQWERDPAAKTFGFYRGIECTDPLAALAAAYLDNWGQ